MIETQGEERIKPSEHTYCFHTLAFPLRLLSVSSGLIVLPGMFLHASLDGDRMQQWRLSRRTEG